MTINSLYSIYNILKVYYTEEVKMDAHAARMGDMRNAY